MAEQTLTINTLAATVITPSDVSQFSLDDVAPNIINGGGGTIVDVSGIVALASQVVELDSDVTALEANVATVQADVTALQEDVSGLDATVAQVQTTATSAAETATAASGAATQAQTTANEAKTAATAASKTAQYALTAQLALLADTAQYALKADTAQHALFADNAFQADEAQSAVSATSLNYYNTSYGLSGELQAIASSTSDAASLWFRSETGEIAIAKAQALVVPKGAGYDPVGFSVSESYSLEGASYTAILPLGNMPGRKTLIEATATYALAVAGGSSSGGGFDGSYTGERVELNACSSIVLGAYSRATSLELASGYASLVGNQVLVGHPSGAGRIVLSQHNISIGKEYRPGVNLQIGEFSTVSIHGNTAQGIADAIEPYLSGDGGSSGEAGVHASYLQYYSHPENSPADGSAKLIIDSSAKTFLFYTDDGGDILAATAGSGGSSSGGYPPLVQRSALYYGIVDDTSSLRFGSFADAEGSQEEAVVKVTDGDDIYVTSRGRGTGSGLTYGLAVSPPALRFGSWYPNTDTKDMVKGMYMPNSRELQSDPLAVGQFIGGASSRVWGLMANSTTAAFGDTVYSSNGTINLNAGIKVSEQYVLLSPGQEDSSLLMDTFGTTLSAVFTLRNKTAIIGPDDWAKLKQLADNAGALIALLSN